MRVKLKATMTIQLFKQLFQPTNQSFAMRAHNVITGRINAIGSQH
jgi:hypothetical protein